MRRKGADGSSEGLRRQRVNAPGLLLRQRKLSARWYPLQPPPAAAPPKGEPFCFSTHSRRPLSDMGGNRGNGRPQGSPLLDTVGRRKKRSILKPRKRLPCVRGAAERSEAEGLTCAAGICLSPKKDGQTQKQGLVYAGTAGEERCFPRGGNLKNGTVFLTLAALVEHWQKPQLRRQPFSHATRAHLRRKFGLAKSKISSLT